MSEDMKSQDSDHDSDYENMEDDDYYCGYYDNDTDDLDIDKPKKIDDPEYFEYDLLQVEDVERFLNEEVEVLCSSQKVSTTGHVLFVSEYRLSEEFEIGLFSPEK